MRNHTIPFSPFYRISCKCLFFSALVDYVNKRRTTPHPFALWIRPDRHHNKRFRESLKRRWLLFGWSELTLDVKLYSFNIYGRLLTDCLVLFGYTLATKSKQTVWGNGAPYKKFFFTFNVFWIDTIMLQKKQQKNKKAMVNSIRTAMKQILRHQRIRDYIKWNPTLEAILCLKSGADWLGRRMSDHRLGRSNTIVPIQYYWPDLYV